MDIDRSFAADLIKQGLWFPGRGRTDPARGQRQGKALGTVTRVSAATPPTGAPAWAQRLLSGLEGSPFFPVPCLPLHEEVSRHGFGLGPVETSCRLAADPP